MIYAMLTHALLAAIDGTNYEVTDPLSFIEYGVYFVAALAITIWGGAHPLPQRPHLPGRRIPWQHGHGRLGQ